MTEWKAVREAGFTTNFSFIINCLDGYGAFLTAPAISWVMWGLAPRRAGVIVAYNTSHLRQGEAMNVRIRRNLTAHAAVAVSTLLVLAWWATPTAPASAAVESAQDATLSPAGNATPSSPPPPRRLHSSLSMPYFSFAQPLIPRS